MSQLNWTDHYHHRVSTVPLQIGPLPVSDQPQLDFTPPGCSVSRETFAEAVLTFSRFTGGDWPQLAFHVFSAARHPQALNTYFPLTSTLDETGQKAFYRLAQEIMLHPNFDCRLLDEHKDNRITALPHLAYFVATHLAEIFFYRRDLLASLLAAHCRIWLYTTPEAFKKDGGAAGGSFNGSRGCVQLLLSRLFEGFNAPLPGVSPFLHEFGHLLDFLDVGRGVIDHSSGFLPGMRPSDGALYNLPARTAFLKGKRLEIERYQNLSPDALPIGHPYVFQNDTEFIAGYFEMFFRNPHYFAAQNPDLYESFQLTFKQDPRRYRQEDFPYYINQNRTFYLSGQRPAKSGLTLPS